MRDDQATRDLEGAPSHPHAAMIPHQVGIWTIEPLLIWKLSKTIRQPEKSDAWGCLPPS